MTTQRSRLHLNGRRSCLRDSRWVRTISCYRITTAYITVATIVLLLIVIL